MVDSDTVAARLRSAMKKYGLTAKGIEADMTPEEQLSRGHISAIARGDAANPTAKTLSKLAAYLHRVTDGAVPQDYLGSSSQVRVGRDVRGDRPRGITLTFAGLTPDQVHPLLQALNQQHDGAAIEVVWDELDLGEDDEPAHR